MAPLAKEMQHGMKFRYPYHQCNTKQTNIWLHIQRCRGVITREKALKILFTRAISTATWLQPTPAALVQTWKNVFTIILRLVEVSCFYNQNFCLTTKIVHTNYESYSAVFFFLVTFLTKSKMQPCWHTYNGFFISETLNEKVTDRRIFQEFCFGTINHCYFRSWNQNSVQVERRILQSSYILAELDSHLFFFWSEKLENVISPIYIILLTFLNIVVKIQSELWDEF